MNCSGEYGCGTERSLGVKTLNNLFPNSNHIAPLVSNEMKQRLEIYINVIVFTGTSLFGVISNIINIIVYWRQGLKDSISLGFFTLSISDLILVIMSLFTASCYAAKAISPDSSIDFPSVHYVSSGTIRNLVYSVSTLITAFLSLERCCCVVLPFKVKIIFTKSRTAVMLVCIVAVHIVCCVPFFASQGLRWQPSNIINGTMTYKLKVFFTAQRPAIEKLNYIFLSIITPTLSQIIITVCVAILINGLKSSSKFRKAVTAAATRATGDIQPVKYVQGLTGNDVSRPDDDDNSVNDAKLSLRDARLVRTMVLLVVILSMSNVPHLAIHYAQMLVPELNIGRPYQNTYSVCHSVVYVLSSINASVNAFVYYNNSSRYRGIFKSVIGIVNK